MPFREYASDTSPTRQEMSILDMATTTTATATTTTTSSNMKEKEQKQQSKRHLLDLPPEVLNRVFDHIFPYSRRVYPIRNLFAIRSSSQHLDDKHIPRTRFFRPPHRMLRISKALNTHIVYSFALNTHFTVGAGVIDRYRMTLLPGNLLTGIKVLTISAAMCEPEQMAWYRFITMIKESCSSLEELYVRDLKAAHALADPMGMGFRIPAVFEETLWVRALLMHRTLRKFSLRGAVDESIYRYPGEVIPLIEAYIQLDLMLRYPLEGGFVKAVLRLSNEHYGPERTLRKILTLEAASEIGDGAGSGVGARGYACDVIRRLVKANKSRLDPAWLDGDAISRAFGRMRLRKKAVNEVMKQEIVRRKPGWRIGMFGRMDFPQIYPPRDCSKEENLSDWLLRRR